MLNNTCTDESFSPFSSLETDHGWQQPDRRFRIRVACPFRRRFTGVRPIEVSPDFALLLEKAGVSGKFDPVSAQVVALGGSKALPSDWRTCGDPETGIKSASLVWYGEEDVYDIYFDTTDASCDPTAYPDDLLPPVNLLENGTFTEYGEHGLPSVWHIDPAPLAAVVHHRDEETGGALKLCVDESTPPERNREISVSQTVNVRDAAGQKVVFECDVMAEHAPYGLPMTVEIRQFDADGQRLPTFAVQPRYLSLVLAAGQPVHFCETGGFHHDAATCEVRVRFRLSVMDADSGAIVTGPDTAMTARLERVQLRPAERWAWPGPSYAGFVEGAFPHNPPNGALAFCGKRRVAFNGASEACLTTGQFNPDPRATHWGPVAGTLEFYLKPTWHSADGRRHVLFQSRAFGRRLHATLRKENNAELAFTLPDSNGTYHTVQGPVSFAAQQWHHVAAIWDYTTAWMQLFVDGKSIAFTGPECEPWPFSAMPEAAVNVKGMGTCQSDKRSVPLQAFIGGDSLYTPELSAEAAIDEFRVSDIVRYRHEFTPANEPLAEDENTRALWRFDGDTDGIHAGDDGYVRGFPARELSPRRQDVTLEYREDDSNIQRIVVLVYPEPSEEVFQANRAENRLPVHRPLTPPPDPRFVAFVERSAELNAESSGKTVHIRVQGDYPPLMHSLTFAPKQLGKHTLPRYRANDNVVPFSTRTLGETLAAETEDDGEISLRVMEYADRVTCYFNARYCESLPERHRPRIGYTFLKALNIYPFDQCGPLNYTLRRLFLAAGISSSNAAGTHHQFQQAFYGGQWRLFDLSPRVYWLRRDNTRVVSRRGLEDDPWLRLRQNGDPNVIFPGRPSEATFDQAVRPHDMSFVIRDGERVAFSWQNEGKWFEFTGEREPIPLAKIPPVFGNGCIVFAPPVEAGKALEVDNMVTRSAAGLTELTACDPEQPSMFTYNAACPYIFADATITGEWAADRAVEATVLFSADGGNRWVEVWRGTGRQGQIDVSLREHAMARYAWRVRVKFSTGAVAVSALRIRSVFVASPYVHPETLCLGDNQLRLVDTADNGAVKTTLRWVERYRSDLGMALNSLSFYLDGERTHRNVFVVPPDTSFPVEVTLQGNTVGGQLALENLPSGWGTSTKSIPESTGPSMATETLTLTPKEVQPGDIRSFDVVFLRADGETRRVRVQLLCAVSPLKKEAEDAERISGAATPKELPEASGARVLGFSGPGEAVYRIVPEKPGEYALWLRARWSKDASATFSLQLGDDEQRRLQAKDLTGFSDWDNPDCASAKMFKNYGEQYAHFAWYRIPDVNLTPDVQELSLTADKGAVFDAMLLLPETPEMDRAAMNLFQNWNYAPWEIPCHSVLR